MSEEKPVKWVWTRNPSPAGILTTSCMDFLITFHSQQFLHFFCAQLSASLSHDTLEKRLCTIMLNLDAYDILFVAVPFLNRFEQAGCQTWRDNLLHNLVTLWIWMIPFLPCCCCFALKVLVWETALQRNDWQFRDTTADFVTDACGFEEKKQTKHVVLTKALQILTTPKTNLIKYLWKIINLIAKPFCRAPP